MLTGVEYEAAAAGLDVVITLADKPPDDAVSIGVANWDGGRIAAEHLLSLGHTRIGIVAGDRRHLYSRARVDGFRAVAEAAAPARPWSRSPTATGALRKLKP